MTDYIKRAVELADGFDIHDARELRVLTNHGTFYVDYDEQFFLDALAAQLVRQVDARKVASVYIVPDATEVQWEYEGSDMLDSITERGPDRTMSTIRAIVDSGVLE